MPRGLVSGRLVREESSHRPRSARITVPCPRRDSCNAACGVVFEPFCKSLQSPFRPGAQASMRKHGVALTFVTLAQGTSAATC